MQANGNGNGFESSEEVQGMTNAQLNAFLENLAKLIEAQATTAEQAAELVRQAKTE